MPTDTPDPAAVAELARLLAETSAAWLHNGARPFYGDLYDAPRQVRDYVREAVRLTPALLAERARLLARVAELEKARDDMDAIFGRAGT